MTATGAEARFGLAEPCRDFRQPGLPQRHLRVGQPAGAKTIVERLEHNRLVVLADRAGVVAHHVLQRLVNDGAAQGGVDPPPDGVERAQAQAVLDVDFIGVLEPALDGGNRKRGRPRGKRRPGPGWPRAAGLVGRINALGGGLEAQPRRVEHRRGLGGFEEGEQALDEARRNRRAAVDQPGPGQDHLCPAKGLTEIVGRQADAPLDRG